MPQALLTCAARKGGFLMENGGQDRLQALQGAEKVVGTRQVLRGIQGGTLKAVYVANDADTFLYQRIVRAAEAARIPVVRVQSMKELGRACGVDVAAAAVGLTR